MLFQNMNSIFVRWIQQIFQMSYKLFICKIQRFKLFSLFRVKVFQVQFFKLSMIILFNCFNNIFTCDVMLILFYSFNRCDFLQSLLNFLPLIFSLEQQNPKPFQNFLKELSPNTPHFGHPLEPIHIDLQSFDSLIFPIEYFYYL